jgi:hypothetical protein
MPPRALPRHRSKRPRYLGDPLPPLRPPRAPPARSSPAHTEAAQTLAPSLALPARCLAVPHSSSPARSAANHPSPTTPARKLTASTTRAPRLSTSPSRLPVQPSLHRYRTDRRVVDLLTPFSRLSRRRLTPSATPLPPSPFPLPQTDPELQSPSCASHLHRFGQPSTASSIRFSAICPGWEPHPLKAES